MKTIHWLALAFIGAQTNASAQERPPDAVYLTGEGASSTALSGGGGQAEWLHWVSPRTSATLGGTSTSLGGLWWTYGTVGAFTRRTHVMFLGRVSLGSGRDSSSGFAYVRYAGSATIPIAHGFYVEAEGQHVLLANTAATVFKIGGLYARTRSILQMAFYSTLSEIGRTDSVSGRGDFSLGRVGVFGGAAGTTRAQQPIDLTAIELVTHPSREVFGGASVTIRRSQVICAVHVVTQPTGYLSRVILTLRLPLDPRRALTPEVSQ